MRIRLALRLGVLPSRLDDEAIEDIADLIEIAGYDQRAQA